MRDIIRSLTTFSVGNLDHRALVDVRSVAENAVQLALHAMGSRTEIVRAMRDVPPVDANEARLGQVFLSLLLNAAGAIPEGDAADHEIRVATYPEDGNTVVIEIADTGAGIAADVLPRIFDPFFTTKSHSMGAGLGLSTAHGTVKSLGGELTVESTVGRGTVFRIRLPAARGWAASRGHETASSPLLSKTSVLLVETDDSMAKTLARALSAAHDVEVAADAPAALAKLAEGGRYDAILFDMSGTGVSGIEFYAHVVHVAPDAVGDSIFISGSGCVPRARAFVESLRDRCIEKPIDLSQLMELLRRPRSRG